MPADQVSADFSSGLSNTLFVLVPRNVTANTTTSAIKAIIKAYSTAVAPYSELILRFKPA